MLLILAGVSIATLTGQNGILTQANTSKESTIVGTEKEELNMATSEVIMNGYVPSENIDEYYEPLQTELDNIVGEGKTEVIKTGFEDDIYGMYQVTFVDTGNQYYVQIEEDIENGGIKNVQIMTEEEVFELSKEQTTEDLTELDDTQKPKVENGFKADINSENGMILIGVDPEGIIDWGDGTFSKVKETSYGNLGKVASLDSDISLAIEAAPNHLYHKYPEKNKIYKIRIYAKEIYMDGSTALENITDWGQNEMTDVSFYDCINLKEIASLGPNSFIGTSLGRVFENCISLKQIPADFFNNGTNITDVSSAFAGCTSLTGEAIDLWSAGNIIGKNCYEGCTNLTNYEDIPDEWK